MSFSTFVLFFLLVVWLSFGPKWLLGQLNCRRERSAFYAQLYGLRHALPVLTTYLIMALLKLVYEYFEASH